MLQEELDAQAAQHLLFVKFDKLVYVLISFLLFRLAISKQWCHTAVSDQNFQRRRAGRRLMRRCCGANPLQLAGKRRKTEEKGRERG